MVIFGLALTTLVIVAALAFDTGMMLLEKRDQQNAADAAALAGARYLVDAPARDPKAAAREIAAVNGFTQGIDNEIVNVYVPPVSGQFRSLPGYIEVVIRSNRPSIFGGVIGVAGWDVAARSVGANQPGLDLPFSMLALEPTDCRAISVTGSGMVLSAGTVQVNSACEPDALYVGGTGTLEVTAPGATCNAVGEITESKGKGSELKCVQVEDSYEIKDPLRRLEAPPVPLGTPEPIVQVTTTSKKVPLGCPGYVPASGQATADVPATCSFGGSYSGTAWRLFPGYYPGGLDFGKGTFYLEPGTYYIGGGGFTAGGGGGAIVDSVVHSVDAGTTTTGGGVLIYNTEAYKFSSECASGAGTAVQCIAPVKINGGTADVQLQPLDDGSRWDGLVIFQDRDLNVSLANPDDKDVQINGGGSTLEVAGTIYVPAGDVDVNGSTGTIILDQIIASTFKINGNGGTIRIMYRGGVTARVSGVGLVE